MAGRTDDFRPSPGFQGSETTGAEVTIYSQGDDPILFVWGEETTTFSGKKITDEMPSLVSVQTQKAMGAPSGSFVITAKCRWDLRDRIIDDDWVDIVFYRHGRKWHVMRGLVDEVRRRKTVTGSGATTTVFTITGRDFGKIWEITPVWFSIALEENLSGHITEKVFTSDKAAFWGSEVHQGALVLGSPPAAVRGYMFGFLEEFEGLGRANWNPPSSVPNIERDDTRAPSFIKSLFFNHFGFSNYPEREGIDPNFISAGGTLWSLAQEWSDPLYTELFVDLFVNGSQALQGIEAPIDETTMTVVFRDKPFPITFEDWGGAKGKDSPWFSLPLFIIPRETIVNNDTGRGGFERYNFFMLSTPLAQDSYGLAAPEQQRPLWDKDDIFRHGLRRFDVQSKYGSRGGAIVEICKLQRGAIRDWYAINPYLLNGTLDLGIGMPDIRIGSRARVPGAGSEEEDETYYVESVAHNWVFGQGSRTSLGVTRGWRGTDATLLGAVEKLGGRYEIAQPAVKAES